MKKIFLLLLIVPTLLQAQKTFYKINGKVTGFANGTTVFLNDAQGNAVATSTINNNQFTIQGHTDYVSYFQLAFIGKTDAYEMFFGNETMDVKGDANNIKKLTTFGSIHNGNFYKFLGSFYPAQEKLNTVYQAKSNPSLKGPAKDSIEKEFDKQFKNRTNIVSNFINQNLSSPITTFVLINLYQLLGDEKVLEEKYNKLTDNAKQGLFNDLIVQKIAAAKKPVIGGIGTQVPEFSQEGVDGKMVSINEFKGKYVLLDFWASWCGPCRKENPNVVAAYEKFKTKNFTILGISLDQDKTKWLKAISDDMLPWPHVSDLRGWGNQVAQQFQVSSIPQNFLIDPSGKIIASNLRGEELERKLQEILK